MSDNVLYKKEMPSKIVLVYYGRKYEDGTCLFDDKPKVYYSMHTAKHNICFDFKDKLTRQGKININKFIEADSTDDHLEIVSHNGTQTVHHHWHFTVVDVPAEFLNAFK